MDVREPMIELRDVSFRYADGSRAILERITLSVSSGGMLTILGPNGAGKSTLLKVLSGLLHPQKGDVRIGGEDIFSLSMTERARRMALVSQTGGSAFALSVEETVLTGRAAHLGLFNRPGRKDRTLAAEALWKMGITHLARQALSELSGGQRQLVRIARALTQQSTVLILDEPTAHLDLANQMLVLKAILRLRAEGRTVISTSHDPAHAIVCGGEVLLLASDGRFSFGPVADVLEAADFATFYQAPLIRLHVKDQLMILPDYASLADLNDRN